jgi:hypothetical protein
MYICLSVCSSRSECRYGLSNGKPTTDRDIILRPYEKHIQRSRSIFIKTIRFFRLGVQPVIFFQFGSLANRIVPSSSSHPIRFFLTESPANQIFLLSNSLQIRFFRIEILPMRCFSDWSLDRWDFSTLSDVRKWCTQIFDNQVTFFSTIE